MEKDCNNLDIVVKRYIPFWEECVLMVLKAQVETGKTYGESAIVFAADTADALFIEREKRTALQQNILIKCGNL